MFRNLIILIIFSVFSGAVFPCSETSGASIGQIKERGRLVVAMLDRDVPPFFMRNAKGEMYGLDVKLARGIAERLGVELELNRQASTFNGVVEEVVAGRADMAISKISRTLQRAQQVLFSRPYLELHQGLLFNRLEMARLARGDSPESVVRNLQGRVGMVANSSYEGFLKEMFPKAVPVPLPQWEPDVIEAVIRGDILAAYRDELEVKKIIRGRPKDVLKLKTVVLKDARDPIAIVLPPGSEHLRDWVDLYLDTIGLNYTADSLLDEYEEIFQPAAARATGGEVRP